MSYVKAETERGESCELSFELDRDDEWMVAVYVRNDEGDDLPGTPLLVPQAELPNLFAVVRKAEADFEAQSQGRG